MKIIDQDLEHIFKHTRNLWEEFRGQKIFITGGTGFIGRWLLESFAYANIKLDLQASITVLSRNPENFTKKAPELCKNPAISFCKGDIRNFTFPEQEYPFIIHGATDSSAKLNDENIILLFDTITQGTRRALDFAIRAKCRKFLFISSGAVYGKQPIDMTHIPESYAGAPDTMNSSAAYGEGKRVAELLCTLYHDRNPEFETKIARCFAFVGPHLPLDAHFAIGNFINNVLHGKNILVKGDGTPYRSYLYASDLAIWLWTILLKAPSCRPYNVGSGNPISILETANAVANFANPPLAVTVLQSPSGDSIQRYVPDVSRAEHELGLTERINLREAVSRTILFSKSV